MANNQDEKIIIQGVACNDARMSVPITPLERSRGPVSITPMPNDINSGRMPVNVTPLTPGQPAAPASVPRAPAPTEQGEN